MEGSGEDGRSEDGFLLDEGNGGQTVVLRFKALFAGEQGPAFIDQAEAELAVRAGKDFKLSAGRGTIDMDHHVVGLVAEEELAAFAFGKIVMALHLNHLPLQGIILLFFVSVGFSGRYDTNRLKVSLGSVGMTDQADDTLFRSSDRNPTVFLETRMFLVVDGQNIRVHENG